jgi:hypothetical protein
LIKFELELNKYSKGKIVFLLGFLIISNQKLIAQYMPLDLFEMQERLSVERLVVNGNDTIPSGLSVNLNLVLSNQLSLFVVPSYVWQYEEKFSFYNKFLLTNNPDYGPRIGSRYERSGNYTGPQKPGDMSTLESHFETRLGPLNLKIGKLKISESSYSRNDISANPLIPAAYGFRYNILRMPFSYSQGHFWLGYSSAEDVSEGYSRYYAFQELSFIKGDFSASIGGRVIYSGINQAVSWQYLAPLDPFLLSVFNVGEPANNDNHVIDMAMQKQLMFGFEFEGKIIIDEFQIDAADRKLHDDDWGYSYSLSHSTNFNILRKVEINHIYASDYLGIHYGKSTNYEIHGMPLFSEYGPQISRSEIRSYWEKRNISLNSLISIYWGSDGDNEILGTTWLPQATRVEQNWQYSKGIEVEILYNPGEHYASFIRANIDSNDGANVQMALVLYY